MAVLGCLGAEPLGWAKGIKYSDLDRATVRVFSLGDVGIERVRGRRGVVTVAAPQAGHGSGLLVSADGLILTARHVIEGSRRIAVSVPWSKVAYPVRVVYRSKVHDLAFLVVDGDFEHFVTLPKKAPALRVRQTVFAVGYPVDGMRTTPQSTRGIVAGKAPEEGWLQLGMNVNPGNSGGPLVAEDETVLGVVVARGSHEEGVQGIRTRDRRLLRSHR